MEELIKIDQELFLYLNHSGTTFWDGFWIYLSRTISFITVPIFLLVLFYSYRNFGFKKTGFILVMLILTIACTEQLSITFKNSIARPRPCYDEEIKDMMRIVKSYCGGRYGFFSAHAANSSAFASFFGILFIKKNKSIFLFLVSWALLVSYSRIYIGVHYPLDVITGILFGLLLGSIFAWALIKFNQFS